jgi:KipI family sensor histidine kinase inhibitor
MRPSFTFFDCGESALLVDFAAAHSKALSLAILDASERLASAALPGLKECVPGLSSLTAFYDPLRLPRDTLVSKAEELLSVSSIGEDRGRSFEIPVLYGGEAGPDLNEVAALTGIAPEEVVRLHASQFYHVYMLGFLPGFAYMGALPEELRLPRRATPRAAVPAGAVAIVADMTAIYPLESPGGWHLIGTAPVKLWDMAREQEPLLKPGDRVRFIPVGSEQAEAYRQRAAAGWRPAPLEAG